MKKEMKYLICSIKRFYRNIKRKIKNLIIWTPIIINDRQFDYEYIFILLRKKLQLMSDSFKSDKAIGVYAYNKSIQIDECIKLLDRLIEDDFHYNYDKLKEKWGEIVMTSTLVHDIKSDDNEDLYELHITREKIKSEEDEEEYKKDIFNCIKLDSEEKQKCLKQMFNIIENNIFDWWD